ncbi:arylsulfatase [Haliea sp. E17]|uniref:arylsulfatase n=1 Tax=Haliea sp. E17 TaxID=3401576 RepID=UPI003AACF3EB
MLFLLLATIAANAATAASTAQEQPQARPNVLLWMLDDVGYAQLSSYGGLVATPNIDRIAQRGLRYTNYHTAPICSASRAAILSGRNPHTVHIGGHAVAPRPYPGYDGQIPRSAGSIAANLRLAGYRTYALGKWDHIPTGEATPAGPFYHWPTGQGFDRFYGFLAADADNWNPTLIRGVEAIDAPTGTYHLDNLLADQAIAMIDSRDSSSQRAPFFMYWATGTAHAPHHAPQSWIDRYHGKFDMGWDKARAAILEKQIKNGDFPPGTELAPRPEGMPAWDSLDADAKKIYARQMEVFAAALSHADEQFGRIVDALEARGELDNTMIIITSDNGASAEGIYHGLYNEALLGSARQASVAENMRYYDRWGGPETYPHYSFGWAVAGNTPFRYYKQTAHEGGIHVPLVVSWPGGIAKAGESRNEFVYVADIAPTILQATGVELAATVNNVKQQPMDGRSFADTFADTFADRSAHHKRSQYFEMYGNKGLWSDVWSIVTTHRTKTWDTMDSSPVDEPWELYDLDNDPGQVHDLAGRFPDKVAELGGIFEDQARRYHVNPIGNLSDGAAESMRRAREAFQRRGGRWQFSGPVGNIPPQVGPPVAALGYTMTAELTLPDDGASGPVFAVGGQLGGVGLYLDEGKPTVIVNSLGGDSKHLASATRLPAGNVSLELVFTNVQGSADHDVSIRAGGKVLSEGRIQQQMPVTFGLSETFEVGVDHGSPLLKGAQPGKPFAGSIHQVVFDFSSAR